MRRWSGRRGSGSPATTCSRSYPATSSTADARRPAPDEFLFNLGAGEYLVGASPEMYVRVTGGQPGTPRVEPCPIAGTIACGEGPLEDAANIATLLGSAKE